jgi:DNA-directed RNA polymerase subunit RPC12/RpoP
MTTPEALHGLSCPNCGGMITIPEGQAIVRCPYCDLRSLVRGERGLRRYQVLARVTREAAQAALQGFLSSSPAIARNAPSQARLVQAMLVHLPFWSVWARVAGWVFGMKQVGSGDNKRFEPREVRLVVELAWNGAACDVGEFGVTQVTLGGKALQPYNAEELHRSGLVFKPVGSLSDAQSAAERHFSDSVRSGSSLDKVSQVLVRTLQHHTGLVYYPLWVLRYSYRGRTFQVVVDGNSGKVLYGKAPGNTLYRAGKLVVGMAGGAFLAIDVPAMIIGFMGRDSDEGILGLALAAFAAGLGLMWSAFRSFRYGEEYEYCLAGKSKGENTPDIMQIFKEVERWIS